VQSIEALQIAVRGGPLFRRIGRVVRKTPADNVDEALAPERAGRHIGTARRRW